MFSVMNHITHVQEAVARKMVVFAIDLLDPHESYYLVCTQIEEVQVLINLATIGGHVPSQVSNSVGEYASYGFRPNECTIIFDGHSWLVDYQIWADADSNLIIEELYKPDWAAIDNGPESGIHQPEVDGTKLCY